MNSAADFRICFVGDSFTAGLGDPEQLGWVGRVCASAVAQGVPLTAYNLGVRRQTSADIVGRWSAECAPRLPAGTRAHVVFCMGVNDTMMEGAQTRVGADDSVHHLETMLGEAQGRYHVAMIGPPPVADAAHNRRTQALSSRFGQRCIDLGVPYLPVFDALARNDIWMQQVAKHDGAHPQAEGYAEFARLVLGWPQWWFRSSTK